MWLFQRFIGVRARKLPWRPVPYALALAIVVVRGRGADVSTTAANRSAALVDVLNARGLSCAEEDVTWFHGANGVRGSMLGGGRALVRASAHGEPTDLYLVDARLSPEGSLLDVGTTWNLTRTTG